MKVAFRHTLTIEYSRVLENLSLIDALLHPTHHIGTVSYDVFDAIKKKHSKLIGLFKETSVFELAALELALGSSERQDLTVFWNCLEQMPIEKLLTLWLGSYIDLDAAVIALQSQENFKICLEHAGKKAVSDKLVKKLFQFKAFLNDVRALSLELDCDPAFNQALDQAKSQGLYEAYMETWRDNMKERHPLSYCQELMGKPFWNIADYEQYEFVPVYFVSPYRLRLMDDKRMIYIHGLHRRPGSQMQTPEEMGEVLKLLSDPNRLKILNMLYMKPLYGKEIADATGLTTATVSHHLEALRQKGLVNLEQVKQIKYFSANMNAVRLLFQQVDHFIRQPNSKE